MNPTILLAALLVSSTHAELVITEVMADSARATVKGDWWELTNTGTSTVDLAGYKWDDKPEAVLTISTFPSLTILPGESIVILAEDTADVATWKAAWGLTSTQVVAKDQMNIGLVGSEAFANLSGPNGDEVNLYDVGGTLVAHVEFGASNTGKSQAFTRDGWPIHGLHSVAGKHGAWFATDTGSPGDARIHFNSAPVRHASSAYSYSVKAELTGAAAPTISPTSLPSFLTLVPGTGGTAVLANNRPLTLADAGNHLVQLTATSGTNSTIQEYLLTVLNPTPRIILNEYNAVAALNFLNGGTAVADDDGGELSIDSHFNRIAGNGGQWVEFAVVGNGSVGVVDMRGWKVEIGSNNGSGFVVRNSLILSNHTNWQSVPSGTLLTFTDKTTAQGGLDSGFAIRDRRNSVGDTWTNVWMGDPNFLTYTSLASNGYTLSAGVVSGITIDNNGTQFRVRNSAGQIEFGPAGEGVAAPGGTSSKEVFELEGHPTPSISPIAASSPTTDGYDDGASGSTFGQPNAWLEGATPITQSFAPYSTDAFQQWAASYSLAGNAALKTADPDGDGRKNLDEYAFGGNPSVYDAAYPAGAVTPGTLVGWSYVRRSNDPALIYSHQSSENLQIWSARTAASTSSIPFTGNANFSKVTLQFSRPVPTPSKWFLRARAE